jgi:hypothetical protein
MANSFHPFNSSKASNLPYGQLSKELARRRFTQLVTSPKRARRASVRAGQNTSLSSSRCRARGGVLNYSAVGRAPLSTSGARMLKAATKIDMGYVPFAGGAPAVLAVWAARRRLHRQISRKWLPRRGRKTPRAGRHLARARSRDEKRADVAESGYPDYVVITWWGFSAPAHPRTSCEDSGRHRRVLKLPEIQGKLLSQGLYGLAFHAGQFHCAHPRGDGAVCKDVKEAGIKGLGTLRQDRGRPGG